MDSSEHHALQRALRRRSRLRKAGLAAAALLRGTGLLVLLLAVYGALDYFLALQPRTRLILGVALAAGLVGLLLSRLIEIARFGERDMAIHLDRARRDPRRRLLSAWELSRTLGTGSGSAARPHRERRKPAPASPQRDAEHRTAPAGRALPRFLAETAVQSAATALHTIGLRHTFPWAPLRSAARAFGLRFLAALCIVCLDVAAATVIAQRLLWPGRDIPPYSRYTFAISPALPVVPYGGDLEIGVNVRGASVRNQVWCVTRCDGVVSRSACFKEPNARFVQRLERITRPLDVCFAIGKARSAWTPVRIRYQPEIAAMQAVIVPPAYTGLPRRELVAGAAPLKLLAGSRVELRVTSNRDLAGGQLNIVPTRNPDAAGVVHGEPAAAGSLRFSWTAVDDATLSVRVLDVAGAANREPPELHQEIVPDRPPEVAVEKPPPYSLAVAGSVLPLRGHVSDDYGLRYAGFVHGMVGYRDRLQVKPDIAGREEVNLDRDLDLATLGARAGDVLEFYIEAGDRNPALTGVTASDLVRVEIISAEGYAAMIRARTTIASFMARFREAQRQLKTLRETLDKLRRMLDYPDPDPAAVGRELEQLKAAHRGARENLRRMASDFAVYDIEKRLQQRLREIDAPLDKHAEWLAEARPADPDLAVKLARMSIDLEREAERLGREVADAETIAAIARVMREAQRYMQLVQRQSELVRRLERYRGSLTGRETAMLNLMETRQREIRRTLEDFTVQLEDLAGALPGEAEKLRHDALAFVGAVRGADILGAMSSAATAAGNRNGRAAWQSAQVALERMRALLPGEDQQAGQGQGQGQNLFAMLCAGQGQGLGLRPGIAETLAQMLESLCKGESSGRGRGRGAGRGEGVGAGGGGTGDVNDGYWASGQSLLDVPVFGPQRGDYTPREHGGRGHRGLGGAGGAPGRPAFTDGERLAAPRRDRTDSRGMLIEELPVRYREAVKRYFTTESER